MVIQLVVTMTQVSVLFSRLSSLVSQGRVTIFLCLI